MLVDVVSKLDLQRSTTEAQASDLIVHDVKLRALLLKLAPRCAAQVVAGKHEPCKIIAPADRSQELWVGRPEGVSTQARHMLRAAAHIKWP